MQRYDKLDYEGQDVPASLEDCLLPHNAPSHDTIEESPQLVQHKTAGEWSGCHLSVNTARAFCGVLQECSVCCLSGLNISLSAPSVLGIVQGNLLLYLSECCNGGSESRLKV